MIALKLWFDMRRKFFVIAGFFFLTAVLHVVIFPYLKTLFGDGGGISALDSPEIKRMITDYRYYTETRWFGEIERGVIFGIFLILGGVLTERRSRSALLTLSLPVSRTKWLFGQLTAGLCALLILNFFATVIVSLGGLMLRQTLPVSLIFTGTILLTITAVPYLAVTLLATSYTGDRLIAGIISICFLMIANKLDYFQTLAPWLPESLMTSILTGGIPWQAIVSIVAASTVAFGAAVYKFQRTDF